MKSTRPIVELILNKTHALLELMLKKNHAVLQLVVCLGLLSFAIYTLATPSHTPAAVDFSFTVLGTMLGKILKW
jgi:hypothetical protein